MPCLWEQSHICKRGSGNIVWIWEHLYVLKSKVRLSWQNSTQNRTKGRKKVCSRKLIQLHELLPLHLAPSKIEIFLVWPNF